MFTRAQEEVIGMSSETLTKNEQLAPEHVPPSLELEAEALRTEAVEQIRRERRFKMHALVIAIVTPLVGLSWMLTEYYTAHSSNTWPNSFADAPADRPGVWSTWFFYFVGVMLLVVAIDAYRTYARAYIRRSPTRAEVDREVERLKQTADGLGRDATSPGSQRLRFRRED
jgi:hypothetical protein